MTEERETVYEPIKLDKPEAEKLAERLIVQKLLEEAQRGDNSRTAAIDEDEEGLFNAVATALDISPEETKYAAERYFAFKRGDVADIRNIMIENPGPQVLTHPRYNELFRRWTSMTKVIGAIADKDVDPAQRVAGEFTSEEWAAKRYLHDLEERASERMKTETGKDHVMFIDYEGFNLGEVHGFLQLLETGNYGSWFGFPTDDVHKMNGQPHTVEALLPYFAQFKRQVYNPTRAGKFIHRSVDTPLSTALYTALISRADQAGRPELMKQLDEKTKKKLAFTAKHLGSLLGHMVVNLPHEPNDLTAIKRHIDVPETATLEEMPEDKRSLYFHYLAQHVKTKEDEWADHVVGLDESLHDHIMGVIEDPEGYLEMGAAKMKEIKRLVKFEPVYRQIMADGRFSDNERAMFDLALELTGIRRQTTRDWFLDVFRDPDTNEIVAQSPDNMAKFYGRTPEEASSLYRLIKVKAE